MDCFVAGSSQRRILQSKIRYEKLKLFVFASPVRDKKSETSVISNGARHEAVQKIKKKNLRSKFLY